ncbi:MAG: tetratricopeptide (TPR) repeat protein [Bacteroidia bacterium]|jgi:tetratricopeptide (TPR) repeat protein
MNKVFNRSRLYTTILLLCIGSGPLFSQTVSELRIKVLRQEIKLLQDRNDGIADSIRIENLNQIALYQSNTNLDSALFTLNRALATFGSEFSGMEDLTAVTHYNFGQVYEQHGDFAKAETSYIKWYNIRSSQNIKKYRWAMTGMREFYSRHLQTDKLDSIDKHWVNLLDKQLKAGEEPLYGFEASMLAVVDNLIGLGEYYKAESYFLHLLEKDAGSVYWLDGSMFYFKVERDLLQIGDVKTLKDWYARWFLNLAKYNSKGIDAVKTMSIISGHLKYEPEISAYLLEDLFQLSKEINHPDANANLLRFWIPILNKSVKADVVIQKKGHVTNRKIQHCVTFNARAALLPLSEDGNDQKQYLESIKMATKAMDLMGGTDHAFFDEFLTTVIEEPADKKLKKALRKAHKKLQSKLI